MKKKEIIIKDEHYTKDKYLTSGTGCPNAYKRRSKVTRSYTNYRKWLHKGAVVTQRQKSRYLQRTDEIRKF